MLLIHQIPPKPDYFRVKVWRRLQRLGAVPIKNSVYILPRTEDTIEDFQWQMREIVAEGGEASVCEAAFVDGLSDAQIEGLFRTARETDYRDIVAAARRVRPILNGQGVGDLERLRKRLVEVTAIDFFGAPSRRAAHEALAHIDERRRSAMNTSMHSPPRSAVSHPRAATWVTRKGVFVDRIASAWLIRRFIDPKARFKFVEPKGYRPLRGELRFDMFDAEYTHEGEACTFETLVRRFGLSDPALRIMGEIVHDIDFKEPKFGRPETSGIERLLGGVAREQSADAARIKLGSVLFDALYESLGAAATRSQTTSPRRRQSRSARK